MKGLILKDFYMALKYCRAFIIIIAVFLGIFLYGNFNIFFLAYPCLITSVVPVTLFSYDEHDKWTIYSLALPYTRKQLVSSKYIIGIIFGLLSYVITMIATTAKMLITDTFSLQGFLSVSMALVGTALICPAIILPFMFKLGPNKGRIVFYIMCGLIAAIMSFTAKSSIFQLNQLENSFSNVLFSLIGIAVIVLLYSGSWLLSISFYKKREF